MAPLPATAWPNPEGQRRHGCPSLSKPSPSTSRYGSAEVSGDGQRPPHPSPACCCPWGGWGEQPPVPDLPRVAPYLSRGNSHLVSRGRSSSMTPASIGAQLEERRVTRIRDVLDFPEELESRENCGESPRDLSHPAPGSRAKQRPNSAAERPSLGATRRGSRRRQWGGQPQGWQQGKV